MRYDCALMLSYKIMIKVGIILDSGRCRGMMDFDAKSVVNAVGGKGKTHVLFSCVADNFISAIRVSSAVCVSLPTNLIKEVAIRAAQQVSTVLSSTRSLASEGAAVTL